MMHSLLTVPRRHLLLQQAPNAPRKATKARAAPNAMSTAATGARKTVKSRVGGPDVVADPSAN